MAGEYTNMNPSPLTMENLKDGIDEFAKLLDTTPIVMDITFEPGPALKYLRRRVKRRRWRDWHRIKQ